MHLAVLRLRENLNPLPLNQTACNLLRFRKRYVQSTEQKNFFRKDLCIVMSAWRNWMCILYLISNIVFKLMIRRKPMEFTINSTHLDLNRLQTSINGKEYSMCIIIIQDPGSFTFTLTCLLHTLDTVLSTQVLKCNVFHECIGKLLFFEVNHILIFS